MAGVLEFFYNDALDATYNSQTISQCNITDKPPTYNLIVNWDFMKECIGAVIIFNKGTFIIFTVCMTMIWHEWQLIKPIKKWVHESAVLLIMGFIIGIITQFANTGSAELIDIELSGILRSPLNVSLDWLKYAFLPMVILNASYELYHPQFFRQIYDILFLTIVGTLTNIGGTSLLIKLVNYGLMEMNDTAANINWLESFLLSSALAAVDPVSVLNVFKDINTDPTIYYLLFGESTLNDGVTYALFGGLEKMKHYVPGEGEPDFPPETIVCLVMSFVTGPIFAILLAGIMVILSSLVCKYAGPQLKYYLPYITTGFVWMGFYIADKLGFSAIIFTIVCAFGQIRYTFPNITYTGQRILKGMIRTHAIVLEIAIFAVMGFNAAYINFKDIKYSLIVLVIITICRFISVFGLFTIVNSWRQPENRVSRGWQTVLFVGGLRGALAYIMAQEAYTYGGQYEKAPDKEAQLQIFFAHTTIITICFTVIVNGILIKPLIQFFKLTEEPEMDSLDNLAGKVKVLTDVTGETFNDVLGGTECNGFVVLLRLADRKLKKLLIKDRNSRIKLNREDYNEELKAARNWLDTNAKSTDQINIQKKDVMDAV